MSAESLQDLNINTLIGCTDERGSAWHRVDTLMGDESNHYPGHIPVEDVTRRLFNWNPVEAKVAYLVPASPEQLGEAGTLIGTDGLVYRVVETQSDRIGVLRDDNDFDMGVFKASSTHLPYQISLIREAERLTGTTLGISTAGLLAKGSRAWVEFSMLETLHDPKSGFDYRPNLLKADSMDGSLSLTTALTITATVCDNTLQYNLLEAGQAGMLFRRKHTSGLGTGNLDDERSALGILEMVDREFLSELHELLERPVTPKQQIEVMDIIVPLPKDEGRALTLAQNKRDQLVALGSDPMCSPWIGTAWGEVQRFNSYDHHFATAKGMGRSERNTWRALNGRRVEADRLVVSALERVLA